MIAASTLLAGCAETGRTTTSPARRVPSTPSATSGPAGNPFELRPGDQIAEQATRAMNRLRSVRVRGDVLVDDQRVAMDLTLNKAGDCRGSVSVQGQGTTEVLGVDGAWWFRLDTETWLLQQPETGQEMADYVGDRWIVAPEGGEFRELCDLDVFLHQTMGFGRGLSADGSSLYRNDGTDRVAGEEVVVLKPVERSGDDEPPTAYVQVGGEHRLVRVEDQRRDTGSVTFDAFDRPVRAVRPGADEIVELEFGGTTV